MSFCLKIETKTLPRLGCFVRRLLYHGIKSDRQQNCAHRRTRVFIWYIYKCVPQKIPNRLKAFWLRARIISLLKPVNFAFVCGAGDFAESAAMPQFQRRAPVWNA